MLAVLALLAAAVGLAALAPRLLTAGCWQPRHPRTALALWHATLLAVAGCVAAAGVVAVVLALTAAPSDAGAVVATVAGWAALVAVGGAVAAIASGADGAFDDPVDGLRQLRAVPHDEVREADGTRVLVFQADEPFACAVPGREPTLVVTEGLRALLTDAQLRAVLAHERAHLRYRHHLAVGLARLYGNSLPRSRAARALQRTTRLLVELMADDAAARRVGAVHLANALVRVGEATGDAAMIVRAERIAQRRWMPARTHAGAVVPAARRAA